MKLNHLARDRLNGASRPARGAWIETGNWVCVEWAGLVAPRAGRVD